MGSCTLSPQAGLAGYWPCGEGSGSVANDISGNAHNLTLSNTVWNKTTINNSPIRGALVDGSTSTVNAPAHSYSVTRQLRYTGSLTVTSISGLLLQRQRAAVSVISGPGTISGSQSMCIPGTTTTTLSNSVASGVWKQ